VNPRTSRRLSLLAYFCLGSAVGGYLIYLLASEFGSAGSLQSIAGALPVAAVVVVFFVVPLWAATQSWRYLFPPDEPLSAGPAAVLTWIGLSVNWLLPVALVGGEVVKFRLASRRVPRTESLVASLVGDKTLQVATQLLYTLLGLSILAWLSDEIRGGLREGLGLALVCAAVYLFYRLQRAGVLAGAARRLKKIVKDSDRIELGAGRIDAAMDDMYRRSRRWWCAVAWRASFRLLLAVEVALVLRWFGEPVPIWSVLALESIAQAARVAAMVIPAALGAQETAIMAAGLMLGYPTEPLLALAVVKRVRELLVGGAGLIAWQYMEAATSLKEKTHGHP
jgi:putative membrane protein